MLGPPKTENVTLSLPISEILRSWLHYFLLWRHFCSYIPESLFCYSHEYVPKMIDWKLSYTWCTLSYSLILYIENVRPLTSP